MGNATALPRRCLRRPIHYSGRRRAMANDQQHEPAAARYGPDHPPPLSRLQRELVRAGPSTARGKAVNVGSGDTGITVEVTV